MCNSVVNVPSKKKEGDLIFCDSCDAELEIVSLRPLELDWPLDEYDSDFDYDEHEYEEEEYDYDD
jgi:lysine biosynthesis protein LysW